MSKFQNPFPTVDAIIELKDYSNKIVLIKRKNYPYGYALPGGFVDRGESLENAVVREALEETSLNVKIVRQFYTYSDPTRDPRFHTISTAFIVRASGTPIGGDDAEREVKIVTPYQAIRMNLAFDHKTILQDYCNYIKWGVEPYDRGGLE